MKIAGKVVIATVADNETARDFVSLLPLNLSMNDLFGREKFANLPRALSEAGPRKNRYEIGDIAYWSPDHQVAVYYRQDGEAIPSPGVMPIGRIDAGAQAFNVPGRRVIGEFIERYNQAWLLGRHGYRTPADVRRALTRQAA